MNSTWNLLKSKLAQNKKELIEGLSHELIDDEFLKKNQKGCRGRIKNFPGVFYINCGKDGEPSARTGTGRNNKSKGGNDLTHFFWISIVYKFKNTTENYMVSLLKEDLDIKTGNTHQDFTEIQIVKNLFGSPEIGGAYNPAPRKNGDCYILEHQFLYSFPSVVTKERTDKPWGYDIKDIPILDMKDPKYSPQKVAKFTWELIKADLQQQLNNNK